MCAVSILFSVLVLLTVSSLGASSVTERSAVLVDLEVTIDGGTVAYIERLVS